MAGRRHFGLTRIFQGYKVDSTLREEARCPDHEDMVRVPASFWNQLKVYAKENK